VKSVSREDGIAGRGGSSVGGDRENLVGSGGYWELGEDQDDSGGREQGGKAGGGSGDVVGWHWSGVV